MINWYAVLVEQQRRLDEIARAQQHREAGHILRSMADHPAMRLPEMRRYQRFLAYLGDRLIAWGCRLQTRYQALAYSVSRAGTEPGSNPCGCS